MTATERTVREIINREFVARGLALPFKEVGTAPPTGVTTYGEARTVFLQESGGRSRADLSTFEAEEQRLLKEVAANRTKAYLKLQEDPKFQKEAGREYKKSMKRLAEIFFPGDDDSAKRARKSFREGRTA